MTSNAPEAEPLYEHFTVTYPIGTVVESFCAGGATLREVQVAHPLADGRGRRAFAGGAPQPRVRSYTLHILVDDLDELAAVIEAVEGLRHRVECPVFSQWSRLARRDSYLRLAH